MQKRIEKRKSNLKRHHFIFQNLFGNYFSFSRNVKRKLNYELFSKITLLFCFHFLKLLFTSFFLYHKKQKRQPAAASQQRQHRSTTDSQPNTTSTAQPAPTAETIHSTRTRKHQHPNRIRREAPAEAKHPPQNRQHWQPAQPQQPQARQPQEITPPTNSRETNPEP
jgi:hypothetical protein